MTDNTNNIEEHMPVVGSDGTEFARVDCLEGENSIKLTQDDDGKHHWIPMSWVKTVVNGTVQLDRSVMQAQEEWSDSNPADL